MPNISEKGLIMPASPIRKLVPYSEAAKKRGVKVYHLNIGQPDIPTPQVALDAIKNFNAKVIEYGHSAGNESYRTGVAKYYQNLGINVNLEDVLITTGGSEALTIAINTCLNPGDEVIIPEPFYTNYNSFVIENGVNIKPITTSIENGFALPSIEDFEKVITPKTKAILICNPNNPTGYLYSKEELEQLRQIVLKHDLFLISDEVYREFCYDGEKHYSCMLLKDIEENVIIIDSTSKRYSMCGIRVGALVSKNKQFITSALHFCQARLCAPALGQIAAEAALNTSAEYFTEVNKEYQSRRDCLVAGLNKIDGVICPNPKGAFYTTVKLPVKSSENFAQWLLEDFEYQKQTVMVAPASGFYYTKGLGGDEVRIAYILKKDDLTNAIECLKEALRVYKD